MGTLLFARVFRQFDYLGNKATQVIFFIEFYLLKIRARQETDPAPYMKACTRFCYYGRGLFLPQENEVQGDADQDAGNQSPGSMGKHDQKSRDAGEKQNDSKHGQYLAANFFILHVEHCYTSSSVRV